MRAEAADFEGVAQGHLSLRIESPHSAEDNPEEFESTVNLPLRVKIVPTPPRHRRLLWDQFHNLRSERCRRVAYWIWMYHSFI